MRYTLRPAPRPPLIVPDGYCGDTVELDPERVVRLVGHHGAVLHVRGSHLVGSVEMSDYPEIFEPSEISA